MGRYRWTPQKMGMAMGQRRMTASAGVSGAALNPATAKTVIPAREIITLRTVPKTTPSSRIQHRREKPALMIERQIERYTTRKTPTNGAPNMALNGASVVRH